MGQVDRILKDIQRIQENTATGFGMSITMYDDAGNAYSLKGTSTRHHISLDESGQPINALNASIAISSLTFDAANYPYKNASNEVDLKLRRVVTADSSGVARNYAVSSWFPDEQTGLIVMILQQNG